MMCLKILSQHFPGGTEENHRNCYNDSQSLSQDSNMQSSRHESGVVASWP
jgi:hypothetical protein